MGKRHTARRLAMQCLYQYEIRHDSFEDILDDTISAGQFIDDTKAFARDLAQNTFDHLESIDALIKEKAIDWSFERIAIIDKSILRVAICELTCMNTPRSVVINEAVEMAKRYSSEESVKFINGILGNIKK